MEWLINAVLGPLYAYVLTARDEKTVSRAGGICGDMVLFVVAQLVPAGDNKHIRKRYLLAGCAVDVSPVNKLPTLVFVCFLVVLVARLMHAGIRNNNLLGTLSVLGRVLRLCIRNKVKARVGIGSHLGIVAALFDSRLEQLAVRHCAVLHAHIRAAFGITEIEVIPAQSVKLVGLTVIDICICLLASADVRINSVMV